MSDAYLAVNRAYWDDRAPAHAASADYDFEKFRRNPSALSDVFLFDRPRLGPVEGLRGVHVQCHIGTDTLSLARLGARMTGLDLSPVSLEQARALASSVGTEIDYVEADTYSAVEVLGAGRFDLVYSSVGTLCWLPDIRRWGSVVAALLAPGGRLFIRDTHPMVYALETDGAGIRLAYPYFATAEPSVFTGTDTYVATEAALADLPTHEFAHGLGEIVGGVLDAGLVLTGFDEHETAPYRALDGPLMDEDPDHPGEFRLAGHPERLACTFTLQARKPA